MNCVKINAVQLATYILQDIVPIVAILCIHRKNFSDEHKTYTVFRPDQESLTYTSSEINSTVQIDRMEEFDQIFSSGQGVGLLRETCIAPKKIHYRPQSEDLSRTA